MSFYVDQRVRIQHPNNPNYADKLGWVTQPSIGGGKYVMVLPDGETTDRRFASEYVTPAKTFLYPSQNQLPSEGLYPSNDAASVYRSFTDRFRDLFRKD